MLRGFSGLLSRRYNGGMTLLKVIVSHLTLAAPARIERAIKGSKPSALPLGYGARLSSLVRI